MRATRQRANAVNRCSRLWVGLLLLAILPCGAAEWAWRRLTMGAPVTTSLYTRVFWTGHELLVWGANNPDSAKPYVHAAWRWNPHTGNVKLMSLVNAPPVPAFGGQSSVWTGRYLLVWGGRTSGDPVSDSNSGYLYDPWSDSWRTISLVDAPTRRGSHGAVWTGREMLIWGGTNFRRDGGGYAEQFPSDFGAYDPEANRWRHLGGASGPTGRYDPKLVSTGDDILVWGGWDMQGDMSNLHIVYYDDLYRLNPQNGEWTPLQFSGAPSGRDDCATVWTGSEFIGWGGYNGRSYGGRTVLSDGARFRPAENRWLPTPPSSPLGPRDSLDAVWTGSEVVFWGGLAAVAPGARYDPGLDIWTPIVTNGAPAGVQTYNTMWVGDTMLAVGDDVYALGPTGPFGSDLLPDGWQESFFAANPSSAGPAGDPDGDGWSNEWEWRFGTDPTSNRSYPVVELEVDAAGIRVSFPDPDPLLRFTLQTAIRLDQSFQTSTATGARSDGRIRWSIRTPIEDTGFFRVIVAEPPW